MALHGTLDEFPVASILNLLHETGASGVLRIEGARPSAVWVRSGSCVWAETDIDRDALDGDEALLDAVFEMSLQRVGSFRFLSVDPEELDPPDESDVALPKLLAGVHDRMSVWTEMLGAVPGLDGFVELADAVGEEEVVIRPAEWRVLARVQGGRTVAQLLTSGDGLWRTASALAALMRAGLVRISAAGGLSVEPRPSRRADSPLFDELSALSAELADEGSVEGPVELVIASRDEADEDVRRIAGDVLRELSDPRT